MVIIAGTLDCISVTPSSVEGIIIPEFNSPMILILFKGVKEPIVDGFLNVNARRDVLLLPGFGFLKSILRTSDHHFGITEVIPVPAVFAAKSTLSTSVADKTGLAAFFAKDFGKAPVVFLFETAAIILLIK
jgi:hypothetical protein